MIPVLQEKFDLWNFHHGLSLDLLRSFTDEQLALTVGQNMGTLGQQFRHMVRVQSQYGDALITGKIAASQSKIDPAVAQSKEKLITLVEKADIQLQQALEGFDERKLQAFQIDWSLWHAPPMDALGHLQALIEHEILHHGQWIVYGRTHGLQFPPSWQAWGM